MNYSKIVINKLLDKYEKSKHAQGQGLSNKRVLLKIDRSNDLPEYDYHDADIRDEFNEAVEALEAAGYVNKTWARKGILLSETWLNLDNVDQAYIFAERETQEQICKRFMQLLTELKSQCSTDWMRTFANDQISQIQTTRKLSSLCKKWNNEIDDLFKALCGLDMLRGDSMSMRAFSIKCFHNSKYFERKVKDALIDIAKKYEPSLVSLNDELELAWRDQLILLGIYARPELYELSGNIVMRLKSGSVDLSAFGNFGVALPDTLLGEILDIKMKGIKQVIFIENKTCYDEFLVRFKAKADLVFYHGGFISKKKAELINIIKRHANDDTEFIFWGDIDIGGFRMFCRLTEIIPTISPLRMTGEDVREYHETGMERSDDYFIKLKKLKNDPCYARFYTAIDECLQYSVTIEQESMLDSFSQ